MALVHISATVGNINLGGTAIVPLIEDPNPTQNRLFLTAQGHDGTYLNPIFGSTFHYNQAAPIYNVSYPGATNNSNGITLSLQKASILCYAGANVNNSDKEAYSAFHKSLDPNNYPARRNWYTVNNRVIMTMPNTESADANTQGVNTYQIYPSDITQGYIYSQTSIQFPTNIFFEDPINNKLWGIASNSPRYQYVWYQANYDNPAAISNAGATFNGVGNNPYFLGPDIANNTYWVVHTYAAGDPYYVFRQTANGTPIGTTLVNGVSTGNANNNNSRPSNVRYDNSSTRVFYSSHFDGAGELRPIRFTWNPQDTSGASFTNTNCTMVYSTGTFSNYASVCVQTALSTYNADNWHYQPWQFRPANANTTTWYITFWPSDKTTNSVTGSAGPLSTNTRWATPYQRTMMTYTINTTTDSVTTATLTYHSSYTFPSVIEMPRDWLPINNDGTQIAVPVSGKVNFFTFNPVTGWGLTNSYPYEMRSLGLDMQNRLWGVSNEIGNASVHLLTPTVPYTVSVVMPTQNFTYTGTNILTTATLYAYDSGGNQTSIITALTINGNSMLFTDTGTINLTTTTNATTGTQLNLTITGGGVNNIVVGANI